MIGRLQYSRILARHEFSSSIAANSANVSKSFERPAARLVRMS